MVHLVERVTMVLRLRVDETHDGLIDDVHGHGVELGQLVQELRVQRCVVVLSPL